MIEITIPEDTKLVAQFPGMTRPVGNEDTINLTCPGTYTFHVQNTGKCVDCKRYFSSGPHNEPECKMGEELPLPLGSDTVVKFCLHFEREE